MADVTREQFEQGDRQAFNGDQAALSLQAQDGMENFSEISKDMKQESETSSSLPELEITGEEKDPQMNNPGGQADGTSTKNNGDSSSIGNDATPPPSGERATSSSTPVPGGDQARPEVNTPQDQTQEDEAESELI